MTFNTTVYNIRLPLDYLNMVYSKFYHTTLASKMKTVAKDLFASPRGLKLKALLSLYRCPYRNAFAQEQTIPERAVRKTRPPVPLANLLSCMRRLVSATCEKCAVMNTKTKT